MIWRAEWQSSLYWPKQERSQTVILMMQREISWPQQMLKAAGRSTDMMITEIVSVKQTAWEMLQNMPMTPWTDWQRQVMQQEKKLIPMTHRIIWSVTGQPVAADRKQSTCIPIRRMVCWKRAKIRYRGSAALHTTGTGRSHRWQILWEMKQPINMTVQAGSAG